MVRMWSVAVQRSGKPVPQWRPLVLDLPPIHTVEIEYGPVDASVLRKQFQADELYLFTHTAGDPPVFALHFKDAASRPIGTVVLYKGKPLCISSGLSHYYSIYPALVATVLRALKG